MYGSYPEVMDHKIIAINRGNDENESNTIVYRDKSNELHEIDLDVCAENFQKEYGTRNGRCVGDRDITKGYFSLYTSGMHTKILFKKVYVGKREKLFSGSRTKRFMQFKELLSELEYTTYDLS